MIIKTYQKESDLLKENYNNNIKKMRELISY